MPSHCFEPSATGYLLLASLARHKSKNWTIHEETSGKVGVFDCFAVFILLDLPRQVGTDNRAAPEHHAVAAADGFNETGLEG